MPLRQFRVFKQEAPHNAFRGQLKSLNVVPFDMLGIVSSEIFDFKNAVTLKTGLGSVKDTGNATMR